MSSNPFRASHVIGACYVAGRLSVALLAGVALLPAAGAAQGAYQGSGYNPPGGYRAPAGTYDETPAGRLARNVRLLAASPRNFDALIGAGRAALALGDPQAAIGFFGRAEEILPRNPSPKAGTGAALAAMDKPRQALGYFDEAVRLGAGRATLGADRGLVFDLLGSQALAQADYRAALAGPDADEARRRLALSLAISGDRASALAALTPLLARRDPAANRIRALVMALTGDVDSARRTVDAAMPGMARSMEPFLRRLASLAPAEKASAVHFGHIPDPRRPVALASRQARLAEMGPRSSPTTQRSSPRPPHSLRAPPPLSRPSQPPLVTTTDSGASDPRQPPLGKIVVGRADPTPARSIRQGPAFTLPSLVVAQPPVVVTEPPRQPGPFVITQPLVAVPPGSQPSDSAVTHVAALPPVPPPAVATPAPAAPPVVAGPQAIGVVQPIAPMGTAPRPSAEAAVPAPLVPGSSKLSSADRLAEIDRLLSLPRDGGRGVQKDLLTGPKLAQAPPPAAQPSSDPLSPEPQPRIEQPADRPAAAAKADDELAATIGEAKETPPPRAKPKPKPKPAVKPLGRYWVQLAGGARVERMPVEYKRINAARPALFAKRSPHVAELKGWSRLLVGPFKSEDEAQDFVNQLAKADIKGFAWTSPIGQPIEKLPAK